MSKKLSMSERRLNTNLVIIIPIQGKLYFTYCDGSRSGLGCVLIGEGDSLCFKAIVLTKLYAEIIILKNRFWMHKT